MTRNIPVQPVRILHVVVDLTAGGAELMLQRLIRAHHGNSGFEHRVISLRSLGSVGPELQRDGIKVEALGLNSPLGLAAAYVRLRRRIRELQPDIVQTWMYHADLLGGLATRDVGDAAVLWGVRIAEIAPEYGVSRLTGWIRRICALLSRTVPDRIIYVAEAARISHERIGYDPAKSVVVRNGYAIPQPAPSDRTEAAFRKEIRINREALLIGSAGRYNLQKNHRGFIAACGIVAQRLPSARFVLFGRGVDEGNPELRVLIERSGIRERFYLQGERKDLLECMKGLDVFCLHSLSEGFPNVVAEAMSVGIPCVVTDVGDAADIVGSTGKVVPPGDDVALAAGIVELLQLTPSERAHIGRDARDLIEERYSMRSIVIEYEALYADVLRRRVQAGHQVAGGTP